MSGQEKSFRTVKVVVGKDRIQFQTDLTEERLNEIVRFVNDELSAYGDNLTGDEARKRLILVALSTTSKYFDVIKKYTDLREQERAISKEISILTELLDRGARDSI